MTLKEAIQRAQRLADFYRREYRRREIACVDDAHFYAVRAEAIETLIMAAKEG